VRSKIKYKGIKHGLYLLLLVVLPLLSFGDNPVNQLFKKGNEQYAKAKYSEAIQSYQKILNGGYRSAAVYFNLGNAYYKTGDMPSALLYYEKAHKLTPGDDDVNFNIQLTDLKITDKIEPTPEFFITKWWHGFILFLSADTLSMLSVLLLMAGFSALIFYLFTNSLSLKKSSFYAGIVLLICGIVTIFISNRQVHYFNLHHQAIVFSSSVTVKSAPGEAAKPLFVVHEGTKVDILQKNESWVEIELPNGNTGWVASTDVKEI